LKHLSRTECIRLTKALEAAAEGLLVLSGNSAAPSPSRYDVIHENTANNRSATSTPNASNTPVSIQHSSVLLLASSETPIRRSPSRLRETSSVSFEETERSQVSAQSLLGNREDLTVKEADISLVTAQDSLDLLVDCEEHPQDLNNGQGRSESVPYDGTDKSLKHAIQNSYTKFGLETRLQFRYGSGPFDRSIIELSTSWKGRSVLNQKSWMFLNGALQQILSLLPASAKNTQLQKEKGLVQRIMRGARQRSEERSLKAIAVELHRERNHAKDESHLANFEFYSTLIVMRHFDKVEVSAERNCC